MTPTQTACTLEETYTGKTWAMVTTYYFGIVRTITTLD